MSGSSSGRRRNFGLHPDFGRRYERADLTSHRLKSSRHRRRTLLLERVTRIIVAYYARELDVDPTDVHDFAHAVADRLRPEVQLDWTLDRAERRAFEIAEALFEELSSEEGASDAASGGDADANGRSSESDANDSGAPGDDNPPSTPQ